MSDFNKDGFPDLVVGVPGESPGTDPRSGSIAILNGSANGLVANRRFDQENLGLGDNEEDDLFGFSLVIGDFNNDGFDDLVVGVPGESPGDDERSGTITVLNGSATGLVGNTTFEQENLGLGSNEFDDGFGESLGVGDFNNDGFDDLVVGIPGESPGNDEKSGEIAVLNGSANGLVASENFNQENLGLGDNERGDLFGSSLAIGDFNNDGFDDLVVGVPGESPGDDEKSGTITVLNGSASGLVGNTTFEQENLGLGSNESDDRFGESLATGDFNNDGFDDLVVGIPGESPGNDEKSGAIAVLNGSSGGLVASRSFDQENLGLGTNERGDLFGSALAVGDFNNDGFDDLVVGVPGESPGDDEKSGTITVLNGSASGLVGNTTFEQENLGLGDNEFDDLFGSSLSTADFNNDGFDDLVVGIPGESPGDDPQSGAIAVLTGSASGLVPNRNFDQENLGLGTNERGDSFGFALASNREDNVPTPPPNPNPDPPPTPTPDPDGNPDTVELYRFRNTTFDLGTYIFVGREERDSIVADPNLNQIFELEGDGAVAFVASAKPGDDLVPFYRLRSLDIAGTYLFVGQEEYNNIFAEDSLQKDKWAKEGVDNNNQDIPDFYVFGAGTNRGLPFNRFQNDVNKNFLFADPNESAIIRNDPNLSGIFTEQGPAFEGLI